MGVANHEMLFVSSNGFDVAGAKCFGFRARVDRARRRRGCPGARTSRVLSTVARSRGTAGIPGRFPDRRVKRFGAARRQPGRLIHFLCLCRSGIFHASDDCAHTADIELFTGQRMTEERDGSSQRPSGVDYGPTTALWRQHEPHAIGRGMLIGSLDLQDPLPHIEKPACAGLAELLPCGSADGLWAVCCSQAGGSRVGACKHRTCADCQRNCWSANSGSRWRTHRHKQIEAAVSRNGNCCYHFGGIDIGLRPDFPSVFAAALIQGTAGSILGPGLAAISLGLVGHDALAERLGRNQRFASTGGLTAAGIMGVIGYLLSTRDILLVTAAFGVPVILALVRLGYAPPTFTSVVLLCSRSPPYTPPENRPRRSVKRSSPAYLCHLPFSVPSRECLNPA